MHFADFRVGSCAGVPAHDRGRKEKVMSTFCKAKKITLYAHARVSFRLGNGGVLDHGGETMDTIWYIREYRCDNGVCMKTKFPVRETEAVKKSYGRRRTEIRRAEKCATEAKHEAARLLNCNFRAGRDIYLGLDYSPEGYERLITRAGTDDPDAIYLQAQKEMKNYIRRVQRECAKAGVELRYLYVTSDLDGHTLEPVRAHHHMVVNREALEICLRKWTAGGTWSRKLWARSYGDLTEIAEYMIGQVRYIRNAKRYTPSRNLKKAIACKPVKARKAEAELTVPRGCQKIWRGEYYRGRPQHLRYYRPPESGQAGIEDD